MTSNNDAGQPGEMTDQQLDELLDAANEDLLDYVRAAADPNRTLAAIMASSPEAPARPAATPGQIRAVLMISMRVRARELSPALDRTRVLARELREAAARRANRSRWLRTLASLAFCVSCLGFAVLTVWIGSSARDGSALARFALFGVCSLGAVFSFITVIVLADYPHRLAIALIRFLAHDITATRRTLERARERDIARAFAHACSRDRGLTRALDGTLALEINLAILDDPHRQRDRAVDLATRIDRLRSYLADIAAQSVDASGADLSHVKIGDLDVLDGVIWTRQTSWPPGIADKVREQSDEILDGVYQVRIGNTPDRSDLTRV